MVWSLRTLRSIVVLTFMMALPVTGPAVASLHVAAAAQYAAMADDSLRQMAARGPLETTTLTADDLPLRIASADITTVCENCYGTSAVYGVAAFPSFAAPRRPDTGSTLSVNLAILVLGTAWVALMWRRTQMARAAAPRRAADGR